MIRRRGHYRFSDHAKRRLAERFGICESAQQNAEPYYIGSTLIARTSKGSWRLTTVPGDGSPIVIVVKEKTFVTVLTPEMAFADIPMAVFLSLCKRQMLPQALYLRSLYYNDELPRGIEVKVRYPKRQAETLWSVFRWAGKKRT